MKSPRQQPGGELRAYLDLLAGEPRGGQLFNLRWVTPRGRMRQQFLSARKIESAAQRIATLAASTDVFVGVALRDMRSGGRAAISGSHLLYLDCDDDDSRHEVDTFSFVPTMEVASGTPEHFHSYWRLQDRVSPLQLESANRRLALALGADPASVDAARIQRPPETFNYKDDPPRAVALLAYRPYARYSLAELVAELPCDPSPAARPSSGSRRRRAPRSALERDLLAIPAAEYVRVLIAREPNRAGKVLCPFHEETEPSLLLYPDGTFYCYGRHKKDRACGKGGTIFDFAAALWGLGTRGRDFQELCRRLAAAFGITQQPDGGS
ncbi:MAG: DNA-primase RepB domain-containing protein [Solirubrobacterales bacterium]